MYVVNESYLRCEWIRRSTFRFCGRIALARLLLGRKGALWGSRFRKSVILLANGGEGCFAPARQSPCCRGRRSPVRRLGPWLSRRRSPCAQQVFCPPTLLRGVRLTLTGRQALIVRSIRRGTSPGTRSGEAMVPVKAEFRRLIRTSSSRIA